MSIDFGLTAFQYSTAPHLRRHGPKGYRDASSYKPWLRDEFTFRCVYCLIRERWYPSGAAAFGVDHIQAKSRVEALKCVYDNLLYVCNRCNSEKGVCLAIDPCSEALGLHLRIIADGSLIASTNAGAQLIDMLNLNYKSLQDYRRRKIEALARWKESEDQFSIIEELGFPDDLPSLSGKRCENSRPDGVNSAYFALKDNGVLPQIY